jgi:hypothetical protein
MTKYKCPKCNREFNRNEHLIRHINKKNICVKIYSNIPNIPNIPNNEFNKIIENQNVINQYVINQDNNNECESCHKIFSSKYNLNKHIRNNVCGIINKDDYNLEIKQLLEQLANKDKQIDILMEQNCEFKKIIVEEKQDHKKETIELHKMIFDLVKKETKKKANKNNINSQNNGIINNTNTANINNGTVNNNNITIQFGKEDLSIIDKKHFLNLIKSNSTGAKIITDLVKMIHFNDEYPQFQNVCMTDLNRDHILLFDGVKWNTLTNSGDKIIPEIIEKAVGYSNEKDNIVRPVLQTNKKALSRLDVIKKYTIRCDDEHLEELRDATINENIYEDNTKEIADCEQFIILVSNKVKELIYNEKDNVIKKKNTKNINKLI